MMETRDYLAYISKVIHTTIAATVDDEGLPVTAAIDMMDSDDNSLYFLTARGKGFYDRLIKRHFLALTAIKGEDSMSSVAVSVRGKVRELGYDPGPAISRGSHRSETSSWAAMSAATSRGGRFLLLGEAQRHVGLEVPELGFRGQPSKIGRASCRERV